MEAQPGSLKGLPGMQVLQNIQLFLLTQATISMLSGRITLQATWRSITRRAAKI